MVVLLELLDLRIRATASQTIQQMMWKMENDLFNYDFKSSDKSRGYPILHKYAGTRTSFWTRRARVPTRIFATYFTIFHPKFWGLKILCESTYKIFFLKVINFSMEIIHSFTISWPNIATPSIFL